MEYIDSYIEEVLERIEGFQNSEYNSMNAVQTMEYPNIFKNNPLKKITLTYGYESIDVNLVNDEMGMRYKVDVKVGLSIYAPMTCSGHDLHRVFMDVVKYAASNDSFISSCGCKSAKFNRNTSTIVLDGWIEKIVEIPLGE